MNRQQLVDAVGERLGDRRTAATAVEAVLDTVSGALAEGERVSLFGFGVFEKVERAARTARNPATGATVQVPATSVPRFRPGQSLKDAVNGRAAGTGTASSARARTGPTPGAPRGSAADGGQAASQGTGDEADDKGTGGRTADSNKAQGKKADSKKAGAKKADSKKADSKKADSKRAGAKKADSKRAGGKKGKGA